MLRVKFLDGDREAREFVRKTAEEWARDANVRFQWLGPDSPDSNDEAEVRISLKQEGAWAYLGTDALSVAQEQPTVALGAIAAPDTPAKEREQTVLRTFGHVLGLLNEHQNPNANLPWNKEAVYRELTGPPNHWDRQTVDRNILKPTDARPYPWYRELDPASVMMPELPGALVHDAAGLWSPQRAFTLRSRVHRAALPGQRRLRRRHSQCDRKRSRRADVTAAPGGVRAPARRRQSEPAKKTGQKKR